MVRLTIVLHPDEAAVVTRAIDEARRPAANGADPADARAGDLSAESAPGKAWVRRTTCEDMTETLQRNPAGQSRPANAGDQPEPSVAWFGADPGCEAYTGSVRAV